VSDTTATEQQTHDGEPSEAPGTEDAGSVNPDENGVQPTPVSDADAAAPVDADAESVDDSDEELDAEAESGAEGEAGSGRGRRSRPSLRRLEEEGEVAADYLEELLDIVDLDGDIDIDVENGRASVAIVAEEGSERDLRRLVGSRGEVLEALQELSRLAVQARTGERSRLMLDVAGFRAARRRKLEDIAARVCQDVTRTGEAVRMEPMTAFERKVVHDVVADAGLVSESEGEDPGRRVVVHPAGA